MVAREVRLDKSACYRRAEIMYSYTTLPRIKLLIKFTVIEVGADADAEQIWKRAMNQGFDVGLKGCILYNHSRIKVPIWYIGGSSLQVMLLAFQNSRLFSFVRGYLTKWTCYPFVRHEQLPIKGHFV